MATQLIVGGQFESDWETAKVEWAGILILRNLLILRAWGCVWCTL